MNQDSRMLAFLSIMALVFSCVMIVYGFAFFGWRSNISFHSETISPGIIVAIGIVLTFINGIAANILSDQLSEKIKQLPTLVRVGIPLGAAVITLVFSILFALMST